MNLLSPDGVPVGWVPPDAKPFFWLFLAVFSVIYEGQLYAVAHNMTLGMALGYWWRSFPSRGKTMFVNLFIALLAIWALIYALCWRTEAFG